MLLKNFIFFKITLSLFFLIYGIYLMIYGFNDLNKNLRFLNKKNEEKINKYSNVTKKNILKSINENIEKNTSLKTNTVAKTQLKEIQLTVKENDTFSNLIDPFFENNLKNLIISKLNKQFDFKYLKIGQKIYLYKNNQNKIEKIILPEDLNTEIVLTINLDQIKINKEKIKIIKEINSLKFSIDTSLYEDGLRAKIPIPILSDAIRLYSFDIDFQRDIRKETIFEVSYEILHNTKRNKSEYGNIQYINLIIENKNLEYFIFKTNDGYFDYFNKEGKNVKKSLLKTPIDGARLSSNFGMRKHPISGFNKLHKGVDFAAPTGTPIYAGGNGVVEFAGVNGGYGKYIRIRHNNMYKTAYAHLSGFKKGIGKGVRVNQGEVIGYVGSTGKSTGPHLHYEIIYQNKQINPMKLKLPSGKVLEGLELEKFNKTYREIYAKHLFALYE